MAANKDEASSSSAVDDEQKKPTRRRPSRRQKDSSNFSFIHFTGETVIRPGRAPKAVRAQAARASANRRLETIERRREAKRANSADPTQLTITAEAIDEKALSPLSQNGTLSPLSPLSRARSAPPTLPPDEEYSESFKREFSSVADEWTCDLNAIVQNTLHTTFRAMDRLRITCDTTAVRRQFQEAALYNVHLMAQCLELLATTIADQSQKPAMSRSLVVLLRHKLIVAVQAVIQEQAESRSVLAAVVALLAGWEVEHGEQHACEYHLHALAGLLPSNGSNQPRQFGADFVDISKLYVPSATTDIPLGFRFYQSLHLLPACIVDTITRLDSSSNISRASSESKRIALVALACRLREKTDPAASSIHDGLMLRVCNHIQIAGSLLAMLIPASRSNQSNLASQEDVLNEWYAESLTLGTDTLLGTIYDEVLTWSLCIFCGSVRHPATEQVQLLKKALEDSGSASLEGLSTLLGRYIAPQGLLQRLRRVLRVE